MGEHLDVATVPSFNNLILVFAYGAGRFGVWQINYCLVACVSCCCYFLFIYAGAWISFGQMLYQKMNCLVWTGLDYMGIPPVVFAVLPPQTSSQSWASPPSGMAGPSPYRRLITLAIGSSVILHLHPRQKIAAAAASSVL